MSFRQSKNHRWKCCIGICMSLSFHLYIQWTETQHAVWMIVWRSSNMCRCNSTVDIWFHYIYTVFWRSVTLVFWKRIAYLLFVSYQCLSNVNINTESFQLMFDWWINTLLRKCSTSDFLYYTQKFKRLFSVTRFCNDNETEEVPFIFARENAMFRILKKIIFLIW